MPASGFDSLYGLTVNYSDSNRLASLNQWNSNNAVGRVDRGASSTAGLAVDGGIGKQDVLKATHNPQALNRNGYAWNNPIRVSDPSGHDTYAVGMSVSYGGFGFSGNLAVGVAWDDHGEVRLFTSEGAGGSPGGSAGGGLYLSHTGTDDVDSLASPSEFCGFLAGTVKSVSFDLTVGTEADGRVYYGYEAQVGLGINVNVGPPMPVESHGGTQIGQYVDPTKVKPPASTPSTPMFLNPGPTTTKQRPTTSRQRPQ